MIRKFTSLIFLLALPCSLMAQDFNQYRTLQSRWSVPSDFTGRSSQKYYKDIASIDAHESRFQKRAKKEFFLESNFGIGDFLTSGRVLFNDEASAYLSEVLDVLLKDDTALRKQLRIYVVKSAAVNAFATNNGIIFVTMGLLARLENEAQLAWILSHEIIHFREQHVINSFVKGQEIQRSRGMYKNLSLEEKDYAKSSFNKEQETDSDAEGLKLFLKTEYTKQEAIKVFDILAGAHLPHSNKAFHNSYFESKSYVLPARLKLDSIRQPNLAAEYDDSKSSHPNLKKRKEAAGEMLIKEKSAFSEKAFLVSELTFKSVSSMAAFEVLRAQLLSGEYIDAFYQSYLLYDKFPSSEWVQVSMGKALYGLAKWGSHNATSDYEGEIQRFAHLVHRQQPLERLVMALRYLYPLQLQYPENEELRLMVQDLLVELALKDDAAEQHFARRQQPAAKALGDKDMQYLQQAFADFEDQTAFFKLFDDVIGRVRQVQKEMKDKKKKKKKLEAPKPKVDKVLVVQPVYKKIDKRKRKSIRHEASEDVLVKLDAKVQKAADRLNMQVTIMNTNAMGSQEVELFNDHSIVQDWLREKKQHENPDGISPIHNELQEVMKKHGTDYLVWMGGLSLTERDRAYLGYAFLTLLSPVFAVPTAYTLLVPKKHTLFFSFTFDTRRESLLAHDIRLMKLKDNNALLQSNIYYTLFKLKHQRP